MIPIWLNDGDANAVPEALGALNWVMWSTDSGKPAADLYAAIHGDPDVYEQHRRLAAEAAQWLESGRNPDLLIGDRRSARSALDHLERTRTDALARPTPDLEAYVAASARATGRERRSRRNRWVVRVITASFAVVLAIYVVNAVRDIGRTSRISTAINLAYNADNLDRLAELSAAVLVQNQGATKQRARKTLIEVLSGWSFNLIAKSPTSRRPCEWCRTSRPWRSAPGGLQRKRGSADWPSGRTRSTEQRGNRPWPQMPRALPELP